LRVTPAAPRASDPAVLGGLTARWAAARAPPA
jgi:hypothetical protein